MTVVAKKNRADFEQSKPKATSFSVSYSTFDDFMPRNKLLEMGLEGRPFTTAARYGKNHAILDPALFTVTPDGMLHSFVADEKSPSGWQTDNHPIPEFKDALILRMDAVEREPDAKGPRFLVAVMAMTTRKTPQILFVEKSASGWTRLSVPVLPGKAPEALARVAMAGGGFNFATLDLSDIGPVTIYASSEVSPNMPQFAFDNRGNSWLLSTSLRRPDARTIALRSGKVGLVDTDGKAVIVFDSGLTRPAGREWNFDIKGRLGTAIFPQSFDKKRTITPVNDAMQKCHAIIVNDLVHATIYPVSESGALGQPCQIRKGHIAPAALADIAASIDAEGRIHIFATDSNEQLWHSQYRPGERHPAIFWQGTGQFGHALSVPEQSAGHVRAFVMGLENGVDQIVADRDCLTWARSTISVGTPVVEARQAHVHAVQISTVTAQAAPVGGSEFLIHADHPVMAEYEGRLIRIAADRPTALRTNMSGTARLKLVAKGLDAPMLSLSYPGNTTLRLDVRPQDAALLRLSGKDPKFPVDGKQMKEAGLLPGKLDEASANLITDSIQAAAGCAYAAGSASPMQFEKRRGVRKAKITSDTPVGVSITWTKGRVVVRDASNDQDAVGAPAATMGWSDFTSWVGQQWEKLTNFVCRVADGVVRFVVNGVTVIAETARQIAEGIHAMIGKLGELANDLIEAGRRFVVWLAEKLGWDDVIRAKKLFKSYSLQALADLEQVIGTTIPGLVSQGIEQARSGVEQVFDKLIQMTEGQPGRQADGVNQSPVRNNIQSNGATVLSVQHAVPEKAGNRLSLPLSQAFTDKVSRLCSDLTANGGNADLETAVRDLAALFTGKESLSSALTLVMRDLLLVVKRVIILSFDVIDIIQTAIFELVGHAVGLVRSFIEMPIIKLGDEFRWVDDLYKRISGGDSLSLIDLASLLFVAPGVLIFHLVKGQALVPANGEAPKAVTCIAAFNERIAMNDNPGADTAIATDNGSTPVTDGAKLFLKYFNPVFAMCSAAWTLLRAFSCHAEEDNRLANYFGLDTDVVAPEWGSKFSTCAFVVDVFIVLITIGEIFVEYLSHRAEAFLRVEGRIYTAVGILMCVLITLILAVAVIVACLDEIKAFARSIRSGIVWVLSVLTAVIGAALLLWTAVRWILAATQPGRTPAAYVIARIADVISHTRKIVQLSLPIGGRMSLSGNPPVVAAGLALIGLNKTANSAGYLLSGTLYGVAALAPAVG